MTDPNEDSYDQAFDDIFAFEGDGLPPEDRSDPEPPPEPEPEPEEAPAPSGQADPPAEPDPVDYKRLYEQEQQRYRSFEGRYRKEKEQWEQRVSDRQPSEAPSASEPDPEDAFLEQFRQTYNDDVIKAVEVISARKAREIADQLRREAIDPLSAGFAETARDRHFSALDSAHPDWRDAVQSEAFAEWVNQQPSIVARAYGEVLQRGTAPEVIEMLSAYKQAAAPPPAPPRASVDPARARAATAVRSAGHGAVPKPRVDPGDFDAAWAEFPD